MKDKKEMWKAVAIIIITLFIIENVLLIAGFISNARETRKIEECYYDICNNFPDAELDGNVCYCFDYDVLGELSVVKEEYMR